MPDRAPENIVRFGLIGAGVAAETHAREMAHVEGGVIEAVQTRDPRKAEAFARKYNIGRWYDDLGSMLADPAIDAVIVTTPNGLHLDPAVAAAGAGKHVVVEKPLEINAGRARAIIQACEREKVQLHVIYQCRYADAAQQALRDIAEGKLGRIVVVNIFDNQFRTPDYYRNARWRGTQSMEGGGCVITQSTHLIDLAQYLVGPIATVHALKRTAFHDIETEDVAVAALEFENGALGTFSSSTAAYPGLRHLLTISGTEGSIIVNGQHDQVVFRVVAGEDMREIPPGFSFRDPVEPRDYPTGGQRRQLQAITDRIRTRNDDRSGAAEALRSVAVIDAIYESAAGSRPVSIVL